MIDELTSDSPLGKSDHVILKWDFLYGEYNCTANYQTSSQRYDYRRGNCRGMASQLSQLDWSVLPT